MSDTYREHNTKAGGNEEDLGAALFAAGLEFADNPEPRCPFVLLLDTSKSMAGAPVQALNDGLRAFHTELMKDALARLRVEIAVLTFGGHVQLVQDFVTADSFVPPVLQADGLTPMGSGIMRALDLIATRKKKYQANGVAYYRPWVIMITDGAPQGEDFDMIRQAIKRVAEQEANNKVMFFAVGVEGANMQLLSKIAVRPPAKLRGLQFTDLFVWLSKSAERIAYSQVSQQVELPPCDNWRAP
jgi:uncharacterized protein YegL